MLATNILREAIAAAEKLRKHELQQAHQSTAIWHDFGEHTNDYALAFPQFVPQGFSPYLAMLKQQRGRLYVLDLAAPTMSFLAKHSEIDAGIAVTLADTRSAEQKHADEQRQLYLVEGSLLRRSTWLKLHEAMRQHAMAGFDLIVCRPYAGMNDVTEDREVLAGFYYSLLYRALRLLDPRGMLMTELPDVMAVKGFLSWLHASGYEIEVQPPDRKRSYGHRYCIKLQR